MISLTIEIYEKSIDFLINTFFITKEFICNLKTVYVIRKMVALILGRNCYILYLKLQIKKNRL